jgi:tRNA A-37 threonylcarbamoyl transferase component Bud32/tetratricopeptide (TPR) repeat protein
MNPPTGEETIFAEALRLPPEERAAYLVHAASGNEALRRRVETLLGSYGAGDFLEKAAAPTLRQAVDVTVPITEKAGETIGRYKLREQIGEGGCGVVYVAEQSEPVRRRVALKIIKSGMDTKSVIARFEAERQALALMDHPNIAKVFDAGATETGRPYFVMELVRGIKITDFCDEKKLSTGERLNLFIQVCHAIQHAHQKGIIHRDIKPSNILVTVNDGVPVPKVIDFGIAKATSGQQLTDKTIYTAFEQFIGTPAYMSPEQAVLTSLDIDTRSDIYALGVLLYELLTGKTPFDARELLAIGLDEMRRTIREQEPQRPSIRLSTLPGQELSTAAQRRGLEPPKLVSELRGDLDWIVMKALEKDRARRYETANGLAADVQRHLKHEPVVACPPSRLYRFQKAVRRNKVAFAASTAVAMALVVGIVVSMWHAARARSAEQAAKAAEQTAKEEKDSAEDVLKFVRDKILSAGRPEGMGGGVGKDVTLREAINAAESKIAKSFPNRPLVEAAIRKTLGESYLYLGEPELAIPQLERALKLRRERLGHDNEHTVFTMDKLRDAYRDAGKPFEFLPFYEEAFKLAKSRLGAEHTNTLRIMASLGEAYRRRKNSSRPCRS